MPYTTFCDASEIVQPTLAVGAKCGATLAKFQEIATSIADPNVYVATIVDSAITAVTAPVPGVPDAIPVIEHVDDVQASVAEAEDVGVVRETDATNVPNVGAGVVWEFVAPDPPERLADARDTTAAGACPENASAINPVTRERDACMAALRARGSRNQLHVPPISRHSVTNRRVPAYD